MKETNTTESVKIQMSALNPFIVDNLPDNTESKARGKEYIN